MHNITTQVGQIKWSKWATPDERTQRDKERMDSQQAFLFDAVGIETKHTLHKIINYDRNTSGNTIWIRKSYNRTGTNVNRLMHYSIIGSID